MKTTKEWLQDLPDGYRERALRNLQKATQKIEEPSIDEALFGAFEWERTPEGSDFWGAVMRHYKKGTPLPPLQ